MKIGVIIDSFRRDFASAVNAAAAIGADGIQVGAKFFINDDWKVDIKDAARIMKDAGIKLSAICGDMGCGMFYNRDRGLIETEKKLLDTALELGSNIVTTHIGVVPEDTECEQYKSMQEVCFELAEYAKSLKGHFAVETGPEKADLLLSFLKSLGSDGVAVNLDPANLTMCAGDDAVEAVYTLKDYIVHTHAKDGIMLKPFDTKRLYAAKYFGLEPIAGREHYREVPLGEGGVKWEEYLRALRDIGFEGYLTIEREAGEDPAADIGKAIKFLDGYKVR